MNNQIKPMCDEIADNLIRSQNPDGKRKVFLDPITMMIVSTIINVAIQILIPIIKKKCAARAEKIKSGAENPSFFTKLRMKRAIKQAEYKTRNNLATYQITHEDAQKQICSYISTLDIDEIDAIIA